MRFGKDGRRYVGVGENASGANSQDLSTQLGRLLRFNTDGSIPADSAGGHRAGGAFVGNAITGATFYPMTAGMLPATYRGSVFFGDRGARFIDRLDPVNGNAAYSFAGVSANPVDMLVASDGALLVLTRSGMTRFSSP